MTTLRFTEGRVCPICGRRMTHAGEMFQCPECGTTAQGVKCWSLSLQRSIEGGA